MAAKKKATRLYDSRTRTGYVRLGQEHVTALLIAVDSYLDKKDGDWIARDRMVVAALAMAETFGISDNERSSSATKGRKVVKR